VTLHSIIEEDLNAIWTALGDDAPCLDALLDDVTPCKVTVSYGSFMQLDKYAADSAIVTVRASEVGEIVPRQKLLISGKTWFVHSVNSSDGHLISLLCISNKRLLPPNMV